MLHAGLSVLDLIYTGRHSQVIIKTVHLNWWVKWFLYLHGQINILHLQIPRPSWSLFGTMDWDICCLFGFGILSYISSEEVCPSFFFPYQIDLASPYLYQKTYFLMWRQNIYVESLISLKNTLRKFFLIDKVFLK